MPIWKIASAVFTGGTEQIKQFKGKKVRARAQLQLNVYDPINNKQESIIIKSGAMGLISNQHPTQFSLLVAFDLRPTATITTLENIMRGGTFKVVIVNEITFKQQFEVEF